MSATLDKMIVKETTDFAVKPSEFFTCTHTQTISHKSRVNCYNCGLFMHEGGINSYKSPKMKFGAYFDPVRYYSSSLKQRQSKIVLNVDSEFYHQRNSLLELVKETSDKLKLSTNTMHLAIYFMDIALSRLVNVSPTLFPVYAATSVMLAAKSIELDERIPFISKLQRYSGLVTYKPREFAAAEQAILRELSWNLQCVMPIDLLDYYFSQGVLFSNDVLLDEQQQSSSASEETALKEKNTFNEPNTPGNASSKNQSSSSKDDTKDFANAFNSLSNSEKENGNLTAGKKKTLVSDLSDSRIFAIVQKMEKDYVKLANLFARDYRFYDFDIKIMAASAVCFVRKVNGIATPWNRQLSAISNHQVAENSFSDCLSIMESRFKGNFVTIPLNISGLTPSAKRSLLMSPPNPSNVLQRDSENKAPSITTPTKLFFKNNLQSQITSASATATAAASQSSSAQKNKLSGQKPPAFKINHFHESTTNPLNSVSNVTLTQQKVNTVNYFQTNSNQQALLSHGNNTLLHHKNSLPLSTSSASTAGNSSSFLRSNAGNYLGITRLQSNIL